MQYQVLDFASLLECEPDKGWNSVSAHGDVLKLLMAAENHSTQEARVGCWMKERAWAEEGGAG